jgi:hypothetical protein
MNQRIIAFAAAKQSGKTTAAEHLVDNGYTRLSFAQPIRDMTWYLMQLAGLPTPYSEQLLTTHKEVVIPEFGVSARYLMQTLGTDWGRGLVHPQLWIMLMSKRLANTAAKHLVIDDIRFEDEATLIRDRGGLIIHINRYPAQAANDAHISESGIAQYCYLKITNTIHRLKPPHVWVL